jgi:hypothetical protein
MNARRSIRPKQPRSIRPALAAVGLIESALDGVTSACRFVTVK